MRFVFLMTLNFLTTIPALASTVCPSEFDLCGDEGETICSITEEHRIPSDCDITLERPLRVSGELGGSLVFEGTADIRASELTVENADDSATLQTDCEGTESCGMVTFVIAGQVLIIGDIDFSHSVEGFDGSSLTIDAGDDVTVSAASVIDLSGNNVDGEPSWGEGGKLSLKSEGNLTLLGEIYTSANYPGEVTIEAVGNLMIGDDDGETSENPKIKSIAKGDNRTAGKLKLTADNIDIFESKIELSRSGSSNKTNGGHIWVESTSSFTMHAGSSIQIMGGRNATGGTARIDAGIIHIHSGAELMSHGIARPVNGGRISLVARDTLSSSGQMSVGGDELGGTIELISMGDLTINGDDGLVGRLSAEGPGGRVHLQSRNGTVRVDGPHYAQGAADVVTPYFTRGLGIRIDGCELDLNATLETGLTPGPGDAADGSDGIIELIRRGSGEVSDGWQSLAETETNTNELYFLTPEESPQPDLSGFPGSYGSMANDFDGAIERCVTGERFPLDEDRDGSQWDRLSLSGDDCNDQDPATKPGVSDGTEDNIDQNCSCDVTDDEAPVHAYAEWLTPTDGDILDACDGEVPSTTDPDGDGGPPIVDTAAPDTGEPGEPEPTDTGETSAADGTNSSIKYGEPAEGCGCSSVQSTQRIWMPLLAFLGLVGLRRRQ